MEKGKAGMTKISKIWTGIIFGTFLLTNVIYAQAIDEVAKSTTEIAKFNPLLACVYLSTIITGVTLWAMNKKDERIDKQTEVLRILTAEIGRQNVINEKTLEHIKNRPCIGNPRD